MVLMVAIDDMQGHRESARTFMEEFREHLGEEAEIADLDGRLDPIRRFGLVAGLDNQVEMAMAVTENEDQHRSSHFMKRGLFRDEMVKSGNCSYTGRVGSVGGSSTEQAEKRLPPRSHASLLDHWYVDANNFQRPHH